LEFFMGWKAANNDGGLVGLDNDPSQIFGLEKEGVLEMLAPYRTVRVRYWTWS
jgi:hypothetical protein